MSRLGHLFNRLVVRDKRITEHNTKPTPKEQLTLTVRLTFTGPRMSDFLNWTGEDIAYAVLLDCGCPEGVEGTGTILSSDLLKQKRK